MKALVEDTHSQFKTIFVYHVYSNSNVVWDAGGLEMKLLKTILQQIT
jgi:hypothetical protein